MTDLRDQLADFETAARRAVIHPARRPIPITRHRDLGALLRALRREAGLSLRDLAPVAYVSKAGLSKRELSSGMTVGALVDHVRPLGYTLALIPLTPDPEDRRMKREPADSCTCEPPRYAKPDPACPMRHGAVS